MFRPRAPRSCGFRCFHDGKCMHCVMIAGGREAARARRNPVNTEVLPVIAQSLSANRHPAMIHISSSSRLPRWTKTARIFVAVQLLKAVSGWDRRPGGAGYGVHEGHPDPEPTAHLTRRFTNGVDSITHLWRSVLPPRPYLPGPVHRHPRV